MNAFGFCALILLFLKDARIALFSFQFLRFSKIIITVNYKKKIAVVIDRGWLCL